jgi:hypothetical protein
MNRNRNEEKKGKGIIERRAGIGIGKRRNGNRD